MHLPCPESLALGCGRLLLKIERGLHDRLHFDGLGCAAAAAKHPAEGRTKFGALVADADEPRAQLNAREDFAAFGLAVLEGLDARSAGLDARGAHCNSDAFQVSETESATN